MKKITYILFFALLSLTGCSDFLGQDSKSNVITDGFYTSKVGYESLMNSTYSSLRSIYGKEPWLFSAGTDLYASGRNKVPSGVGTYSGLIDSDGNVESFYKACYAGIQLANTAIYYADLTEQTDLTPRYKAEARFIRAFYYYLLVQQFGGVAIVNDMILDNPRYNFPRESAETVYNLVISELEDLKTNLPVKYATFGRVDQRAANHFLAKTYLARGYESFGKSTDFEKAAQYADLAINSQKLTIDFNSLFSPSNEKNAEIIWSVQYDASSLLDPSKDGNMQQSFFGTYLGGSNEGGKYTTSNLTPTVRLHQLFTKGDDRYEGTFMVQFYTKYYDLYTKPAELSTTTVRYYYPPAWAVADTAAWRAENKATRAKTIIMPMQAQTLSLAGKPIKYETAMTGDVFNVSCVRKFDDPTSLFSTNGSTRDVVLARTGESYLVAAEAYLKAGNTAKALERINEVRKRASQSGYDLSIAESDLTIDFILDERARELAGEYHRWMDLKRTGKLIEYSVKYNPEILDATYFKGTDGQNKILRPIPRDAIDLNQAKVTQNPGY